MTAAVLVGLGVLVVLVILRLLVALLLLFVALVVLVVMVVVVVLVVLETEGRDRDVQGDSCQKGGDSDGIDPCQYYQVGPGAQIEFARHG